MNKAFVREPDDNGQRHCPRCGSLGVAVGEETLAAHAPAEARRNLSVPAFFCPYARCEVAYFDLFERAMPADALGKPVYPKDHLAPLCGCFGLTRDEIEQDVREGVVRRVKELLAKAKSPAAHCRVHSASGQCCVPEVQRCYMQLRAGQG